MSVLSIRKATALGYLREVEIEVKSMAASTRRNADTDRAIRDGESDRLRELADKLDGVAAWVALAVSEIEKEIA